MSVDYVTFGIILDDIVFPDGHTRMGILGGGGVQTAFGMRLWSELVGLVAGIGADLPPEVMEWLRASGIDTTGVRLTDFPTPRAWQVLEENGRRTQVWRVSGAAISAQLTRKLDYLPPSYRRARGFHLGVHPLEADLSFIAELRQLGGVVSIEPFKPAERLPNTEELRELLEAAPIFSPNIEEAVSLLGCGEPRVLLKGLLANGAEIVALRMGAQGALVARRGERVVHHIPPVPVQVIDPVGAGNAFCGGFLVGWVESSDLRTAGLYGCVAASFAVEQVGVPVVTEEVRAEARKRLAALQDHVETLVI